MQKGQRAAPPAFARLPLPSSATLRRQQRFWRRCAEGPTDGRRGNKMKPTKVDARECLKSSRVPRCQCPLPYPCHSRQHAQVSSSRQQPKKGREGNVGRRRRRLRRRNLLRRVCLPSTVRLTVTFRLFLPALPDRSLVTPNASHRPSQWRLQTADCSRTLMFRAGRRKDVKTRDVDTDI